MKGAVETREREEMRALAEVAARDREGRNRPKSEGRREEDEKCFGPMGREGKKVLGNKSSLVR